MSVAGRRAPHRIGIEPVRQACRRRRIVVDRLAETAGVFVGRAVQFAARVDCLAVFCCADLANTVEVLETEADRIGDLVATGAGVGRAMRCQPFTRRLVG